MKLIFSVHLSSIYIYKEMKTKTPQLRKECLQERKERGERREERGERREERGERREERGEMREERGERREERGEGNLAIWKNKFISLTSYLSQPEFPSPEKSQRRIVQNTLHLSSL
jgi:hypothetical protein